MYVRLHLSLVAEGEIIQINGVGRLLVVSIHLVVDCDPVPTRSGARIVILVHVAGDSVQSDGLIQQLIASSALDLNRQVVPRIAVWIT